MIAGLFAVTACGGADRQYDAEVADYEPVYCYQTIGRPTCYAKPDFRDERGLVNFYGPAPKAYERPPPPPQAKLVAPPSTNYFVRDAEPIPKPSPRGPLHDRPWLLPDHDPDDPSAGQPGMASEESAGETATPVSADGVDAAVDGTEDDARPNVVEDGDGGSVEADASAPGVSMAPPGSTETAPIE